MNIKQLTDEKIKYIVDNMKCEFYHTDGYWVDMKTFFVEGSYEYHHTEYRCQNDKGEKWFGCPDEIVGKIIHVDEIFDEYELRGLREE